MKLQLASRKSHLARLQALTVGDALKAACPDLEIEYRFRESLGDINLNDPLWKMPEKGVFTQDFVEDLRQGRCDLVVHSWKDLPLQATPGTRIVATLPREDMRDLLLVREDAWLEFQSKGGHFRVLTSSPRRIHNLGPFLKQALPGNVSDIVFETVRGNIPTRVEKLLTGSCHGLVLAKAALDRLMGSSIEEFASVGKTLREALKKCRFMVLPLSANPTAAAQGALAIEVSESASPELLELLAKVNCTQTFTDVQRERDILGSYGGGCHQKIGVSILQRPYGRITFLRGLTDSGKVLDSKELDSELSKVGARVPKEKLFPIDPHESLFFSRETLSVSKPDSASAFWVARADAWPESWKQNLGEVLWTAGLETWFKLARRGLWVSGSSEGLGEIEDPGLEVLVGSRVRWVKLSHNEGVESLGGDLLPTYRLKPRSEAPSLAGKTHFFWMSGTAFRRALELNSGIRSAHHSSGPGHTAEALKKELGKACEVYLSHRDWLAKYML